MKNFNNFFNCCEVFKMFSDAKLFTYYFYNYLFYFNYKKSVTFNRCKTIENLIEEALLETKPCFVYQIKLLRFYIKGKY